MLIKTSELSGAALDLAVAQCEGRNITLMRNTNGTLFKQPVWADGIEQCNYSTFWAQGGPIIEREGLTVCREQGEWSAYIRDNLFNGDGSECFMAGPTPLVAAMRCYVASKLSEEVEVPDEIHRA